MRHGEYEQKSIAGTPVPKAMCHKCGYKAYLSFPSAGSWEWCGLPKQDGFSVGICRNCQQPPADPRKKKRRWWRR